MTDSSASNKICAICSKPLLVVETSVKPNLTVVDDIELPCMHHFYWDCMYAWDKHHKRGKCPTCKARNLTDSRTLVTVWDDLGEGPQAKRKVDLGEMMDEERFYDTHPDLKAQLTFISLMIPGGSRGAYKFIEYGVDVDTRWGSYKRTALHTAALENDPQAIVQLLKWGATRSLEDTLNKDLAQDKSSNDAIVVLGGKRTT